MVAAVGDPRSFDSARRYASFFGLTPREHSSGDKRVLGGISKRGDRYLRMLLTHGARSVLQGGHRGQTPGPAARSAQDLGARSAGPHQPQQGHLRARQQARPHRLGRLDQAREVSIGSRRLARAA